MNNKPEWRPLSEAPRDGSWILVHSLTPDNACAFVVRWGECKYEVEFTENHMHYVWQQLGGDSYCDIECSGLCEDFYFIPCPAPFLPKMINASELLDWIKNDSGVQIGHKVESAILGKIEQMMKGQD